MCKSLPFSLGRYRAGVRAVPFLRSPRTAGTVAIVLLFATWASVTNAEEKALPTGKTSDVENCDRTLGPTAPGLDFSGVFEGTVFDGGGSAAAQVKLVRIGDAVRGSYLRGEICGTVSGKVTGNRLEFSWNWAGNSGHGIASQTADRLSGTSGFRDDTKGGGTFVLVQRQAGRSASVAWPAQDINEATALIEQVTQLSKQGRYSEAIPLAQRALTFREKALGPDHPDVVQSLNNLGLLYDKQGRYADAEPLFKQALTILEKAFGPDNRYAAFPLNNLAEVYRAQGRYADAEPLYKRSWAILEKALGPDHLNVATALNNLAEVYRAQGRYADAESHYKQALAVWQKALGPDHLNVATALNNLAEVYRAQGRYADAEAHAKQALTILEKALGPDHLNVAPVLNNLEQIPLDFRHNLRA